MSDPKCRDCKHKQERIETLEKEFKALKKFSEELKTQDNTKLAQIAVLKEKIRVLNEILCEKLIDERLMSEKLDVF